MYKKILTLIFLYSFNHLFAQGITLEFVNKTLVGNTWTFDLQATIDGTYSGSNDNWSTMNVRTDIQVPMGATITIHSSTALHPSVATSASLISFPGIGPVGTVEFGLAMDRNSGQPDLTVGTHILASATATFVVPVPGSNLVTPRENGVPSPTGGSFYTTLEDATRRSFVLPAAFPLPIVLKTFDATKHTERSSRLNWTTSSEINSDYFGIERSKDGLNWENLGNVKAAGDSNIELAYQFIDDKLPLNRTGDQIFYYRLRLTDLDGRYNNSDIRGVNFGKLSLGPISIYPNPTTERVNIDLTAVEMQDGVVDVMVYDMKGSLVIKKQIIGNGIELINVEQLPSDAYNFVIRQGEQIYQQKVIKID